MSPIKSKKRTKIAALLSARSGKRLSKELPQFSNFLSFCPHHFAHSVAEMTILDASLKDARGM